MALAGFDGAGGGATLGAFKGVMLSNRPGAVEVKAKASAPLVDFNPHAGSGGEHCHPAGRDVDFEERVAKLKGRERPSTLTDKIRAELAALVDQKNLILQAKAAEEARKAERRARLAESQAKLRQAIRAQAISVDEHGGGDENARPGDTGAYKHLHDSKSGAKGSSKAESSKPAWARSSAAAAKDDEDEEEDLLGFVSGFNPDKYEEDLEDNAGEALLNQKLADVEAAEAAGKARLAKALAKLEASAAGEEGAEGGGLEVRGSKERARDRARRRRRRARREARRAARAAARAAAKAEGREVPSDEEEEEEDSGVSSGAEGSDGGSEGDSDAGSEGGSTIGPLPGRGRPHPGQARGHGDDSGGGGRGGRGGGDDAASIATSILSSASSIRGVHSKRSLTAMVERTQQAEKDRIAAAVANGDVTGASAVSMPVLPQPRVAEHNDYKESIDKVKGLVQNLPYQHRNPAV